jgi:hypothetical protein
MTLNWKLWLLRIKFVLKMCILFLRMFDEKRARGMLSLILIVFIHWEREETIAIVEGYDKICLLFMLLKCYQHLHHLSWVISRNIETRICKIYSLSIFEMIGCNNKHEEEICQYSNESHWYSKNMKCMQRKSIVFNNGDQNKTECFPLLFSMFNKSWEIL